jgi:hypothetical protein
MTTSVTYRIAVLATDVGGGEADECGRAGLILSYCGEPLLDWVVSELLDSGGMVVAFSGGEPIPDFLPGARWQHRPTNFWWWLESGADLGIRLGEHERPLVERLTLGECTWHYHGMLEAPEGAQVLVKLAIGEALLHVDQVSTAGTIVVSTLDPISHYGGYFMPATGRFLDAFLSWAADASQKLTTPSS